MAEAAPQAAVVEAAVAEAGDAQQYFELPFSQINEANVMMTIFDGRTVYE